MPENTMPNQEKLSLLREEIAKQGLDGFILPRTDAFQSEFLAPCDERLAWLTGFTGSAGYAVILKDKAVVMSDGRYTIQIKQQVDGAFYSTGNSIEVSPGEWIEGNFSGEGRIGYDPWLHTQKQIDGIRKHLKKVQLVPVVKNPVDVIWRDRPALSDASVFLFPDAVAGRTSVQKRKDVDFLMKEKGVDALILTQADSICWLLNVRGRDVPYSPLVLSYVVLHKDGIADWFIDPLKVPAAVERHLAGVTIRRQNFLLTELQKLKGKTVWVDSGSAPLWFVDSLSKAGAQILDEKDPCAAMKAIKSAAEIDAIRVAHVQDAVAMIRFMHWLSKEAPSGRLSEVSVAEKLDEFRRAHNAYVGESFATISGFAENGAIIHYRASDKTNKKIQGDGILLLDSGGQYASGGTTDITRSFAVGTPTQEMRENYTRVLKGHIALSRARFPVGTTGAQVDVLARQPLWDAGLDYAHGTGHGVGCFLGVHEEAASISPRGDKPLQAGMLLSNEPGYYKEGGYGIRIENLVLVVESGFCAETGKVMLGFETMTMVPYDPALIVDEMLGDAEKTWLSEYYEIIERLIQPYLSQEEADFVTSQIEIYL